MTNIAKLKCDINHIESGEIISRTSYLKVNKSTALGLEVINSEGVSWEINGKDIIESEMYGSRQFSNTEILPISKIAKAFVEVPGDAVFTVCFTKKDGTERILTGHRTESSEDVTYLGLSQVVDLELEFAKDKNPVRNIYHSSILWFICKNVKYQLKK